MIGVALTLWLALISPELAKAKPDGLLCFYYQAEAHNRFAMKLGY